MKGRYFSVIDPSVTHRVRKNMAEIAGEDHKWRNVIPVATPLMEKSKDGTRNRNARRVISTSLRDVRHRNARLESPAEIGP